MTAEIRAVVVPKHGEQEVLAVQELPRPEPGPGQLLVEVAASGVNFIEVYQRQGVYPTNPPFVLGSECAGRVAEIGPDVDDAAVGDLVATVDGEGTHATFALVDAARAVPVPAGVAPDIAAAAMLQGMTAQYLVNSTYPLAAGDTTLIHAAAGGVGQLLVQMAKTKGARVIATVGSEAKVEVARRVGADEVIRYDAVEDVSRAVRELVPDGVDVVYDGVGKATFDASLASIRQRGMMVLYGGSSGQVPPFDVQRLNAAGSLYLTRPKLAHYVADRAELADRAADVLGALADGSLHIEIGGRYSLDDAAEAYRELEGRRTTGKLLIVP